MDSLIIIIKAFLNPKLDFYLTYDEVMTIGFVAMLLIYNGVVTSNGLFSKSISAIIGTSLALYFYAFNSDKILEFTSWIVIVARFGAGITLARCIKLLLFRSKNLGKHSLILTPIMIASVISVLSLFLSWLKFYRDTQDIFKIYGRTPSILLSLGVALLLISGSLYSDKNTQFFPLIDYFYGVGFLLGILINKKSNY
ncbi:MAG: hypothetical protein CV087_21365 [Candidatus Brocadia sp. WS118]|nr:MAG: hypothetical protein CV087_21365 [Candidatus Brocadia sp. WS118]